MFVDAVVSITLERDDIHVKLPLVAVNALVVPDLSSADLLIGIDVVSRTGGLQLRYGDDGSLSNVIFGDSERVELNDSEFVAMVVPVPKLSRHIVVSSERDDVSLEADDSRASWDSTEKCWTVKWKWVGDKPPTHPVGSGVGEYSRKSLLSTQEQHFQDEIAGWIKNEWLVLHDSNVHGEVGAVLPLMAVAQAQTASTPVRPVLDYREMAKCLVSNAGFVSPVCGDTLRAWRQADTGSVLLDV